MQTTVKKKIYRYWVRSSGTLHSILMQSSVTLMDWDLVGSHDFMGRVIIPLDRSLTKNQISFMFWVARKALKTASLEVS